MTRWHIFLQTILIKIMVFKHWQLSNLCFLPDHYLSSRLMCPGAPGPLLPREKVMNISEVRKRVKEIPRREKRGEQMLLGSLGTLPKVTGDGKKTETPDKLRAPPKNIWAELLLPETCNMARKRKCGGGSCPERFQVGDPEMTQLAPHSKKSLMSPKESDAKRTSGTDGTLGQAWETSGSSDLMTRTNGRGQGQQQQQAPACDLRAGRTNDITSLFSKDRGQCPKASRIPKGTKPEYSHHI